VSQTRAGTRAAATAAGGSDQRPRAGLAAAAASYLPAAVAAAVMTLFGLWGIVRQNKMGNDEVATRYAALLSLGQLAHLLSHVDAVHGTYYLLMHAWVVLGSSPTVLRVPSVIAMVAGAALVAIIGTRLTGSGWAGLVAGLVMALTPSISYYAQTARSYALVLACVAAATLALMRVLQAEAAGEAGARLKRWWVLYGALVVVAAYLNEMALLILIAHAVTVLAARYGRPVFERFVVTAVVCGVLLVPLALLSFHERAAIGWIGRPTLRDLGILWHDYFGGNSVIAAILTVFAVVAVLPPRGWQWRNWRAGLRSGATPEGAPAAWWEQGGVSLPSVALPLLLLPGGLLILESVVLHPLYTDRYVLYSETAAALLVGGGCYRVGQWLVQQAGRRLSDPAARRALLVVPGVAALVCSLVLNLGAAEKARSANDRQFDFGGPSFYVGAHARPGDGVLFINSFYRKARLGYPADFRNVTDFAMAQSPQRAGNFNGTDKPLTAVQSLILTYQRIWVVGNAPSPGLANPQMRDEALLLLRDFRLAADQQYKNVTVTLWIRR
jgi:mannosyltransferase